MDHYCFGEGGRSGWAISGAWHFFLQVVRVFWWVIACTRIFFYFLSSINRTCIEESTCLIYFVHGSWLPLNEFFSAVFVLQKLFLVIAQPQAPSSFSSKKNWFFPKEVLYFPVEKKKGNWNRGSQEECSYWLSARWEPWQALAEER